MHRNAIPKSRLAPFVLKLSGQIDTLDARHPRRVHHLLAELFHACQKL
jgi:hypothetical protein